MHVCRVLGSKNAYTSLSSRARRNKFRKYSPAYWWPSIYNNYTSSHWFWLIALGAMFQVPTVPVNISKGSRVFCRSSGWSIGWRSFGKLPTSFRSRKLWLTSAGPSYRDGFFFSLRTFVSREVTSRLYPCAFLTDVTDARSYVRTHTTSPSAQRSLHFTSQHPPACVRWHRQRFYLDRWDRY